MITPPPQPAPEMCRAVKHGRVDLHCTLSDDHEGWHEADCLVTEKQEVSYDGSRHVIETTTHEHVKWERVDHAREAVKMLLKDRPS
jgi:hypothetical protein